MSKRIGVFGGTFSPFHMGHLNSLLTVAGQLELDQIRVIPTYQSPNRPRLEGPNPEERLTLVRLGVSSYSPLLVADDREVQRGGLSYTLDTIQDLRSEFKDENLFLIIGADQFEDFDHWKAYTEILQEVDLVVTTRPGFEWPENLEGFPPGLRGLVKRIDDQCVELNTGRQIFFVKLNDVDVSGSELRRRLRSGESLVGLVPEGVDEMIREKGWFEDLHKKVENYMELTQEMGRMLNEKNAINVVGFNLGESHYPAQFTLVASGSNTRQTNAIAEHLMNSVHKAYGFWPQNIEGQSEGRWVVLDYGALIVHIFYDYARHEYKLEELWSDAQQVTIHDPHAAFRAPGENPAPRRS